MRRDWLNSTASPTPPAAASRKPSSVVVSVTRREAPSTAQSEIRVEKTRRGPGSTYGGMLPMRTKSSHTTTPSASTATGSSTRSTRSTRVRASSFALASLIIARSRSRSWAFRRADGARQGFRDLPAMADIISGGAKAFVARIGRVDRELGEDAAGPRGHHDDPLREIDRLEHRMGDEHDRLAHRLPERQQIVVEAKARDLVERGERLVHQQKFRLGDERACDGGAHLHPTRELARIALREAGKSDARERGVDARLRRRLETRELERQAHIRGDRRPRHQRRLLEHEADAARTGGACGLGLQPLDRSAGRLAQARDDTQRRGLAAARRTEQRHELARPHIEVETLERDHAPRKGLADALERDDGSAGVGGINGHVAYYSLCGRRDRRPKPISSIRSRS